MNRAFWAIVYFVYSLGGVAVRKRRSRILEITLVLVGSTQIVGWIYALATNYSANIVAAPLGLTFGVAMVLIGFFFRHVRVRSAENPRYLAEMRRAH